jgi:imidazolonepropionase-like amidohydrolase
MRPFVLTLLLNLSASLLAAQFDRTFLLRPDRIFDGHEMHERWVVLVREERIAAVGPRGSLQPPTYARTIELPGMTLLPGLIEGHSHLLLHPYDETQWRDQVLRESQSLRVARATVHARESVLAGFTTLRDLGTEGAAYADVGLKQAIAQEIVPGPRLLVATRAIVATGSYGPRGFAPSFAVPLGAEPADGGDTLVRVVRDQIGKGADWVKVYADYRWGPAGEARPTFSRAELELVVKTARSSGRSVASHAVTPEAIRRSVLAGARTIEHGSGGTPEVFALMAERGVALCPTLAAGEAIAEYQGWNKGQQPAPARVLQQRTSFRAALEAGVRICAGSDVGVFRHGDNARELELMVEYGMSSLDALRAATSGNAEILHLEDLVGKLAPGLMADLVAVRGNPAQDISSLRQVQFVMLGGRIYREP